MHALAAPPSPFPPPGLRKGEMGGKLTRFSSCGVGAERAAALRAAPWAAPCLKQCGLDQNARREAEGGTRTRHLGTAQRQWPTVAVARQRASAHKTTPDEDNDNKSGEAVPGNIKGKKTWRVKQTRLAALGLAGPRRGHGDSHRDRRRGHPLGFPSLLLAFLLAAAPRPGHPRQRQRAAQQRSGTSSAAISHAGPAN